MKLKIKVTKENIDLGCKTSGYLCPIARAIHDVFPHAFVWEEGIKPDGAATTYRKDEIPLPKEVQNFIWLFDNSICEAYEPFEFEIDIPDALIDQINIDEIKELLKNHPTLELI